MNIKEQNLEMDFFDILDNIEEKENKDLNKVSNAYLKVVGYSKGIVDNNGFEHVLDVQEQEDILNEMYDNIFYSVSGKANMFVTTDEYKNLIYLQEKDMLFFLQEKRYPQSLIKVKALNPKNNKIEDMDIELVNIIKALKYIRTSNQIENINFSLDLFAKKSTCVRDGLFLNIVKNGVELKRPKSIAKDERQDAMECIEDYKEHNPYHELFVKLIIASMFTNDRKMAYFYFIVNSDWGKSFWMSIFQELNACSEVKYQTLEASPGPILPEEIQGKIFTYEDEFKNFGRENKEFTHNCKITAKNRMRSIVSLYAKVMLSAETSNSVKDNVDKQIINRITLFNLKNKGKLSDRDVIKKHGEDFYHLALQNYTYVLLIKEIELYRTMKFKEASKKAAKLIRVTWNNFKISDTEELMASLEIYVKEKLQYIISKRNDVKIFNKYSEYIYVHDVVGNYKVRNEDSEIIGNDFYVYLSRVKDLFLLLIEESPNKSFKGTAQYKKDTIEEILKMDIKTHYHPLIASNRKCIKLPYSSLFVDYNNKEEVEELVDMVK